MKKMKKLFAMLLAFTMVLGMTMTASAAIKTPSDIDAAEVKVTNLDEGLTVTAYQIVDADYYDTAEDETEHGFKGYEVVADVETLLGTDVYNMEHPESEHITTIANAIANGDVNLAKATLDWNEGVYKANLTAGAWVILVDSKDDVNGVDINLYNPMLAGVYYTNATGEGNEITGGNAIDAAGNWALQGTEMYAKSTITNFDKKIVEAESENVNADDVAVGDTVTFELSTYMPKYSLAYKDDPTTTIKELQFKLTDELSAGLTPCDATGVIVKADGKVITEGFTKDVTGQIITIDFTEDGIRANGGKTIVVTYTAVLNDSAVVDQNQNPNNATLEFTNDPSGTIDSKTDVTYHHTFEFQVKKVDEKGALIKDKDGNPIEAEFTLTRADDSKEYVETSENGILTFTGLDSGTYTLVETKAPTGYQIDTTERTVVIEAEYDQTTGKIQSYTITISGEPVESWNEGDNESTVNMLTVMNTKLIELPSTGGIGTTIFTVAGCGIMIAAAFFFFASRKKEN